MKLWAEYQAGIYFRDTQKVNVRIADSNKYKLSEQKAVGS